MSRSYRLASLFSPSSSAARVRTGVHRILWSFELSAVYPVGILDFIFSEDEAEKEVRHEVKLRDQMRGVL